MSTRSETTRESQNIGTRLTKSIRKSAFGIYVATSGSIGRVRVHERGSKCPVYIIFECARANGAH